MSKWSALHTWMGSFGLTAYEESNVPTTATLPYLTYQYSTSSFGSGQVAMVVNLWYRTEKNDVPNAKAEQIYDTVGRGGVMIPVENGTIWIKRGSPFVQSISDPDASIRRRYINLTAEFLTA